MITFFTDGSWRSQAKKGGYSVVGFKDIDTDPQIIYAYQKNFSQGTNNIMELKAILHAYDIATNVFSKEKVVIYSDSIYCVKSITEWAFTWAANEWKNSKNEEVKNIELIKELHKKFNLSPHNCQLKWIKGHNKNFGNEIADAIATKNKNKFLKLINEKRIKIKKLDF